MIRNSKQDWTPGQTVRCGFLALVVKAAIPTPGDFRPDSYLLTNTAGDKLYLFTPHHGVARIELLEARELLAAAAWQAKMAAGRATAKAREHDAAVAAINEVLFAEVA